MARIRTFIAVDLGDAVRRRAAALQLKFARAVADVKWVEESNLHVTLLFLGEVDQLDVVPICRIVREQLEGLPPFTVEVRGVGAYPTPRRPKVLWAGIQQGADELKAIHERLEEPLHELGCYRREERAYSPHLTLGRIGPGNRDNWAALLAQHADWEGGMAPVDEVLVMSSELRRSGPLYTVLGRAKLG